MRIASFLLSTTFLAATASAVLAADLPSRVAPPPSPPPLPVFTWTGPYVGINAGGIFNGDTRFDRTTGFLPNNTGALTLGLRPVNQTVRDSGFTGGGQIGYNYQLGNLGALGLGLGAVGGGGLVIGIEADAAYADLNRTDTLSNTTNFGPLDTPGAPPTLRVNQYRGKLDVLGTVRGRIGVAFDQFLVYGTGGFAYGDMSRCATFYGPGAPTTPFFTGTSNGLKTGYAYGGGIEYALPTSSFLNVLNVFHSSAVTIKVEYLHYDLGRETLTFAGVGAAAGLGGYAARVRTDGDLVRAGLNFKL